ncbi:MAG: class I SAM-dependent methyltransferase [Nitrospirae bacterium]|nr:class I SAM-dependent methyltransferase [Nitrospirota bacterium]
MQTITDISIFERNRIAENDLWNVGEQKELLLHRIHAYPAKFPPFLVQKFIEHFENRGKEIRLVADPFCGCGTSALESVKLGKDFWGCDINPVATLIARTKSSAYRPTYLNQLHEAIILRATVSSAKAPKRYYENQRLKYWFDPDTIHRLFRLLLSIDKLVPGGKYRDFFLTGFSNILKPCSRWLTKSIKPQIDPHKTLAQPTIAFDKQIKMMIKAVKEAHKSVEFQSRVSIVNRNFLNVQVQDSFADVIITSPPYVTSYEYADLHQLSAIWLRYTDDYRNLRKGTIGSEHHSNETGEIYEHVNQVAKGTYDKLRKLDSSKAKSVLRYFYDLELAVKRIKQIVKMGSSVAFVIGNTSYKGVHVDNAKSLAQSLLDNNFKNVQVSRRKISYKILTPYRNELGRFTSHAHGRKVYSHEYVLTCEK